MIPDKPDIQSLRQTIFTQKRRTASPLECVHAYARAVDEILRTLFTRVVSEPEYRDELCMIAIGGYGRGEMCPYSDVDLMLLYSDRVPLTIVKALERQVWDLGFLMGFAARTPAECAGILGDDIVTDSALLESTFITGSMDMFTRYIDCTIRPYFRKKRRSFIEEMRTALVKGVLSPADTIYRIEPDVKSGLCCLRDCQRIAWAERVAQEVTGGASRPRYLYISHDDQERLIESYTFLLKVRTELHMVSKRRLDILEVGLQPLIARSFGYPDGAPAALMSDFFRSVTHVRQCVLSFTEKVYLRQPFVSRIRTLFGSFTTTNGLKVIDGILYLRKSIPIESVTAIWVLGVFSTAITCHAEIGMGLRNLLREAARCLAPDLFNTSEAENSFGEILGARRHAGRIVQIMHETGILDKVLPEFTPLTCKVEFDTYHEYTVDQHTLLALRAFDELVHEREETLQRAYLRIANRRVFRLALLLHDSGKALCGDHCRSGAIIARNAASRLGFTDEEQEVVEFLVYHHLDMSELSLRRETEDTAVRIFAANVATLEQLDMLYVLTVLDIRHVGSRTWTGWKAVQLAEIFKLSEAFIAGSVKNIGNKENSKYQVPDYRTETLPEDRVSHEHWLSLLGSDTFQLHTEVFTGFHRVTIVARDRIALLADIAACFIASGLQIISAQVYAAEGGKVIDIFDVEPERTTSMAFDERIERFMTSWKRLEKGSATSAHIVHETMKNRKVKPGRQTACKPDVRINNSDSERYTIIEVRASDRFGLLHTLVSTLSSHAVNINAARIATAVDAAVDVFYVSDADGSKMDTTLRIEIIRNVVLEAVSGTLPAK